VVIRTAAGAHPLARALDETELADVIGTIAGDDTVFVATRGPRLCAIAHRSRSLLDPSPLCRCS
jgi:transcriptional regulator of arginine metabolism